nr:septum site-determining protein MinC [Pseudomarimonas arenosa]
MEQAGELKIGQVGIANLRVREWQVDRLAAEMRERVERAPSLFQHAAVVVDLGSLSQCPSPIEARELLSRLSQAGVHPVALAFGTSEIERLARELGLPLLAKFRAQYESTSQRAAPPPPAVEPAVEPAPAPASAAEPPAPARAGGQIVELPVRSGQQVYAQGRDLTVLAGVGAGAEVIADGSIHVYGALRGRALAGAHGDESARIFCREFHAELVAIAGHYKVFEDLPANLRGRPAQIWLEDEKLCVAELT